MFRNMTGISEFWGNGFGYDDLILCFCLQMLHDNMLNILIKYV